jgi:protein-S-isoprenylcysteine O-methyltransferase Ste14
MPTTYFLISIVAIFAFHLLFPVMTIIPFPWNLTGIIPLVIGFILNLVVDRAFHLANTTIKPFAESSILITSGVFQISRNPIYLGFVLILSGIAVLMGSLSPYLVVIAFTILINRIFIEVEERMLAEKFGVKWDDYKRRVRRWL